MGIENSGDREQWESRIAGEAVGALVVDVRTEEQR